MAAACHAKAQRCGAATALSTTVASSGPDPSVAFGPRREAIVTWMQGLSNPLLSSQCSPTSISYRTPELIGGREVDRADYFRKIDHARVSAGAASRLRLGHVTLFGLEREASRLPLEQPAGHVVRFVARLAERLGGHA